VARIRLLGLVVTAAAGGGLLTACGDDEVKGRAALATPTVTLSAGASPSPTASKSSSSITNYRGTLTATSSEGTQKSQIDIGIYCGTRCNFTGWGTGSGVVVLNPVGPGRYRVDMPGTAANCSGSTTPGAAPVTGDVTVSGATMKFTLKTPREVYCGVTRYAMTYTFSGNQI
jgi:hypothetical protein